MAYNQSDQFFEPSTDTNANFGNSVTNQNNSFFLPKVYSKQVLNFFRKASVAEAITNTDYAGEISAFGDTVNIINTIIMTINRVASMSTNPGQILVDSCNLPLKELTLIC